MMMKMMMMMMMMMKRKHHLERLLSESEPASEVCSHGLEATLLKSYEARFLMQDCQRCDDYDVVVVVDDSDGVIKLDDPDGGDDVWVISNHGKKVPS